jgi:hypothetical protein
MPLQKVKIEILDTAAVDPARGLPPVIEVQFNPTEYALNKGAQIAEIGIPGLDSPILQFVRGQNETLTLEFFFDTTRTGAQGARSPGMGEDAADVRDLTKSIYQLVKIQPRTHAPPRVRVSWGSLSFKAIVESVQQRFSLFSPNGVPLRATVAVTFREYKTLQQQLDELNPQSADHTKEHVVRAGETLSAIAAREYADPRLWRLIADDPANRGKIPSPRRLRAGATLLIPPLGVRSSGSAD